MSKEGKKYDNGKLRWGLLPMRSIEGIIKVLMFGAGKYGDNNWQDLENAEERYYEAVMRHISAWRQGQINDEESGLPHLAHADCCLLFLLWFHLKKSS